MGLLLLDDVVRTDYGQFDLTWGEEGGFAGDFDREFAGQVNGLAGAASGTGLYLPLGRRSGGSQVRIVLLELAPAEAGAEWEDVVEVSVVIPDRSLVGWSTWAGESGGCLPVPAGAYRVRVSARGRDAGQADEMAELVLDHYLLEFWPAATEPDVIVRTGSANAAHWHRAVGSRR